jgi:hypothetical protein
MPPPLAGTKPPARFDWAAAQTWLGRLQAKMAARLQMLALSVKANPGWSREAAVQALLYSDFSATLVRILAYLGALAVLAVVTAELFRSASVAAAVEPTPRAEWIDVAKPFPSFSLSMPELAESGYAYGMRRHATGGGRRDIMSWGELNGAGPHLMVEIYRPSTEFIRFGDARQEIAARTDGQISAVALKPVETIDSKFGSMSLIEFSVKDEPGRQCLGFVRPFEQPRMQLLGWYCTSGPELIDRGLIACALDRLTLLAAGSDAKVGELFARAELKRNFCGQRSPLLAATPKLGPSTPLGAETKLRGRLLAR